MCQLKLPCSALSQPEASQGRPKLHMKGLFFPLQGSYPHLTVFPPAAAAAEQGGEQKTALHESFLLLFLPREGIQ